MVHLKWQSGIRVSVLALLLALFSMALVPQRTEAHAILVRSDPVKDAVLPAPPSEVRMWFSESLNPTYSTAYVVNATSGATAAQSNTATHVDTGNAHVSAGDATEMDLSLKPDLPAAVYVVLYRTQSADDGHILHGSYLFTVVAADGTVPSKNGISAGAFQGEDQASAGQLDGPALFSLIMVTLTDLGVIFWVGIQLWFTFVLQLQDTVDQTQLAIMRDMEQRFNGALALPVLALAFVANIGVLVGQALTINTGQIDQAFNLQTLSGLVSQGQFGHYWIMREVVILVAITLALYNRMVQSHPASVKALLSWANFVLGLALLTAMTLSGHAAAASQNIVVLAILSDFLHLLAASLWVGGMFTIALVYLPVLKRYASLEQARSLVETLPRYAPLAITGVILLGISGPFNAAARMSSWDQLLGTAYGRTLVVKNVLVAGLVLTSAIHVLLFRPRLAKALATYSQTTSRAPHVATNGVGELPTLAASQLKRQERHITSQTRRLSSVLRWEPLLGVAVLLCTGLLSVFSNTLLPVTSQSTTPSSTQGAVKPFTTTVSTTDKLYQLKLAISPDRYGTNMFTVTVFDAQGKPVPAGNVGVSLYTTMLDMDMGTQSVNLQPDSKGHFSASGDLDMGGNWQVRAVVRTRDATQHSVTIHFTVSET